MSILKTLCGALVVVWMFSGCADASEAVEQRFATCTGRLSAQLEHQWLMGDPGAEATERLRDSMAALFDTVALDADRSRLMALRIDAKYAHRALLQRAAFNDQTIDAEWAARRAQTQLDSCSALLLM